jgi:hypothetical protein
VLQEQLLAPLTVPSVPPSASPFAPPAPASGAPPGAATQVWVASHTLGGTQSARELHAVRHPPAVSHWKAPQAVVLAGGHDPVPAQLAAAVASPPAQLAARQGTSAPTKASQLVVPDPSQSAAVQGSPPLAWSQAGRSPWGGPATALQVPSRPATSQASH